MNLLDENIRRDIFLFCRQRLYLNPSEEDYKEFVSLFKDYKEDLRRSEYEYNVENVSSLYEVINEDMLKYRVFIEPKHDGTQIVMKVNDKIHLSHKSGSGINKQDIALLFGVFIKFREDFLELLRKAKEEGVIVKMEIFGKEYSPFKIEKESLNFSVFDVLKGDHYLLPIELSYPHSVEFIEIKSLKDIDSRKVLSWLKSKEGVVVKIYDDSLPYRKAKNFNMLAFKYKPFIAQLVDEMKGKKIIKDQGKFSAIFSELITEYAKDKTKSFEEILEKVKEDHEELKDFIDKNHEIIKDYWFNSKAVRSVLQLIDMK
ncbi:hypothetical protein [Sulfurisphaera ohwakuensis]|uniref:Uncharacterized protein n=1 Tax=Sulfurisphaera ohwakuensis TaxID=69656 RepID=A0A650CHZ9_SULOH|nr:hypothetical protein [Sulfurisphaera ohwakuensis]MBB5253572.1 hypothetical protein [Sulfurisphaera ohwakuensis]QGR17409.1 hypothetical protein D1869_09525 [Sulfurisphaera ohwakuensis]